MELNRYELEIILQAIRNERSKVEQEYIQGMNAELEKIKYNRKGELTIYGVAETLTTLQRFNNLVIKLEDELRNQI